MSLSTGNSSSPAGSGIVLLTFAALASSAFLLTSSPVRSGAERVTAPAEPALGHSAAAPQAEHAPSPTLPADPGPGGAGAPPKATQEQWVSLFDGKSLQGWEPTKFGGEGDVKVEDGQLIMTQGNDMTGVTTTRKNLPKTNYEIAWEGCRLQGNDFFCGLTFPVKDDPCSLILGGWGGGVCGLSSIDGFDASENATSSYREFERDKWYSFRLRVTDPKIEAWIGEEKIVEQELADRRISIRVEVELNRPLGFSTWRTTGAVRNVRLRPLSEKEVADASAKPQE